MNTPVKLGAYTLGLIAVFGAALGVGGAVGDVGPAPEKPSHSTGHATSSRPESTQVAEAASQDTPGGLQVSQNGYTLNPLTAGLKPGVATEFQFSVTGPDGRPVTAYQVAHDKKMHFIVVSRDLGTFHHLHPELTGEGVWSVKLNLPSAGAYRAFADFTPTGGEALTLGADLLVAGDYTPKPLPETGRTTEVDGYEVTLAGDVTPGRSSKLTLTVSKDGKPVTDLQPYLGAYGHLVALRGGDLAYLHVHPDGEPGDGKTQAGPEIVFYAEAPSRGDYRLFLDFKHDGEVRTADFTIGTDPSGKPAPSPSGSPSPSTSADHGDHEH
jgi:hypothetical protein